MKFIFSKKRLLHSFIVSRKGKRTRNLNNLTKLQLFYGKIKTFYN